MTDTKFTPGPWFATRDDRDDELCFISRCNDKSPFPINWIACCCTGIDQNEYEANAHLIAAAPDLYEALEGVSNVLDEITEYPHVLSELEMKDAMRVDHALHEARTALAKARGDHSSSG